MDRKNSALLIVRTKRNLLGRRCGRLTVVGEAPSRHFGKLCVSYWVCLCDCGRQKEVQTNSLRRGFTKSCGCLRSETVRNRMTGAENPGWKGGRNRTKDGYIKVSGGENRDRLEHHLMMEKFLGRGLTPDETVHHRNGVRDDNRIENLELWASNHPSGQRVEDLVGWAKELLRKHEPEALR